MSWWSGMRWLAVAAWIVVVNQTLGYRTLSDASLDRIAALSAPERLTITGDFLQPLLTPRVAGTAGNEQVRAFLMNHFETLGWHVEVDAFTAMTPVGPRPFANVIVTKHRDATERLVLAAHYDSMHTVGYEFIGATDSAVPCALLLDVATSLDRLLDASSTHKTLQVIFFDGEEAFERWSSTDSIYGARHLAQRWAGEGKLKEMDALVLLDLLGTPNPIFHNYYETTHWLFDKLMALEQHLSRRDLLQRETALGETIRPMFERNTPMTYRGHLIGDDHLPFLQRGVPIVHLIPHPFPSVWHKSSDNASCLDTPTIQNLAMLMRSFTAEYLGLDPLSHNEL